MHISTLPFLMVVVFGFLLFLTHRHYQRDRLGGSQRNWIAVLIVILLSWGGISG